MTDYCLPVAVTISAAFGLVGVLWFFSRKSRSNEKGNRALSIPNKPPGKDTLDTATMPPGKDTLDTATMPPGNDPLDTVRKARKEREENGPWEVELSYGGEADLHRHFICCEKNPGHKNFIPIDKFNVNHLPPGYQNNDLVEVVKAISDLTVRVSVNCVSDNRPETVPRSDKPYPCYTERGSNLVRVGSGWVNSVRKFKNISHCACEECLYSEKPKTNFAHIEISTAVHVVYDTFEGAHTTCHLFFDEGGTSDECSGVVTLRGMFHVWSDPDVDWCHMTCVTHDLDLADKLKNTLKIKRKYDTCFNQLGRARVPTIIVSHPHGCSKKVSVGYTSDLNGCFDFHDLLSVEDHLLYTTATCPGSSGAYVWVWGGYNFGLISLPHTGNWEEDTRLNFSTVSYYSVRSRIRAFKEEVYSRKLKK